MKHEILLECARKAHPEESWQMHAGSQFVAWNERGESFCIGDFGCQMALQIALEDEWKFTRGKHGFEAEKKDGSVILYEQSKPRLLYTIIESEGGGG